MKKTYNYVVYPNDSFKFDFDNPLSATLASTIKQAYDWAEMLMSYHKNATSVAFRSENGWKTYFIAREKGVLVRGKIE